MNTNSAFVRVSNADGTQMAAEISDNIIYGTKTPVLIETANAATVTGINNWLQTNASAGPLAASVQSVAPGFRNATAKDYTLTNNSVCIGAANFSVFGLPGKEYYLNELTNRLWRIRAAAWDIGAFESTSTNGPVGPYDPAPLLKVSIGMSGTNAMVTWPLFAQDFQLYQSDFCSPIVWSLAPVSNSTNAAGVLVTAPAKTGKSFFRLKD